MQIGAFLNLLTHVKGIGDSQWQADCPCQHSTQAKHLSVALKDEKILLTCFGSHSAEDICQALNLKISDLFIKDSNKFPPTGGKTETLSKVVAEYTYKDEEGKELFQVVRYEPKSFRQRHKNGAGEYVWNLDGVRRVLYHLPDILVPGNETIFLVEGERDADNLMVWGKLATTSPGGASNWRDEYATYLTGRQVCIIPDNDGPGMSYARQAANSLLGKAELKTILLPQGTKDISDWLDAGNDIETLSSLEQDIEALFASAKPVYRLADEAIQWDKKIDSLLLSFRAEKISEERTGVHGRISISAQHECLSWSYFNLERREDRSSLAGAAHKILKTDAVYTKDDMCHDLDAFCAGLWDYHLSKYSTEVTVGDNEPMPLNFILKPFVLDGGGTILFSAPGRGKSFSGLLWAVTVDAGVQTYWPVSQTPVLFINLERSRESVRRRLSRVNKVLGLPPGRGLRMLHARGKSLIDVVSSARRDILKYGIGMVVLDSISRAGLGDLNENRSVNSIIDALSGLCPTWVALGHTPRQDETHIFGGIHFDAGADIVCQLSSQIAENGTLGIGWQIMKQNDLPQFPQSIFALEFDSLGLSRIRPAKEMEFPDIESKRKTSMRTDILDYILAADNAEATAAEIEEDLGYNRSNVSSFLSKSGLFVKTKKVNRSQYYGVKKAP